MLDYQPHLKVNSFASKGRVSRIKSHTVGRIHHFLSDLESDFFYLFDWDDNIVDIREHFALQEYEKIVDNTDDLNNSHFVNKKTGEPYILSTTFLLTTKEGKFIAQAVTYADKLERLSTQEKLEREKRYWTALGIEFRISTEKELPKQKVQNIASLHQIINSTPPVETELLEYYVVKLLESDATVEKFNADFEEKNLLLSSDGLAMFRWLVANKVIEIDMNAPIDITKPMKITRGK